MNTLTLDIGNTNVKTVVWDGEKALERLITRNPDYEAIASLIKKHDIKKGAVSSVRKDVAEVMAQLEQILPGGFTELSAENCGEFERLTDYRLPIGSDRIAAYYGGETLLPRTAKLIVDCGTAMTIDAVSADGRHIGGDISLGLRGRLDALAGKTALLPKVETDGDDLEPFGQNTESAIRNGAVYGMAGEILFAAERAKRLIGNVKVLMTGGDAEILIPLLRKEGLDVVFEPELVSIGLLE